MAIEPTTTAGAAAVIAAQGVATALVGAVATSSPFALHFADYGAASGYAVIGIATRHCWEASKARSFDFRAMAFDLPTAPMLGIVAYTFALYLQLADYAIPLIVVMLGFLGPEWLRSLAEGIKTLVLNRLGGGKGG